MLKVMADHDVEGHLDLLLRIWTSPPWDDLWRDLHGDVESFQRLGIAHDTPDDKIWQLCQQQGIVLITGNRNAESEKSLEATIEKLGSAKSLPVLTIADPRRLIKDRDYAERVAERVLEYLIGGGKRGRTKEDKGDILLLRKVECPLFPSRPSERSLRVP